MFGHIKTISYIADTFIASNWPLSIFLIYEFKEVEFIYQEERAVVITKILKICSLQWNASSGVIEFVCYYSHVGFLITSSYGWIH